VLAQKNKNRSFAMKLKSKPESKKPTTKTKSNKKKVFEDRDGAKKLDASLFRKNEFALIILGALLLTIIIFFLFFRSSGPEIEPAEKGISSSSSFVDLEKRIKNIEQALQLKETSVYSADDKKGKEDQDFDPIKDRVARLEMAFSVKFDSLIERMGKIEKSILALKSKPVAIVTPKPVTKKSSIPVKKAIKKGKKVSMFHTVKKGETLYYISKKYNTSIAALRKLNNLATTAKIYPGDNILIR